MALARITKKDVRQAFEAYCTVTGSKQAASYNDVGGLRLDNAGQYGGWVIERIINEDGAVSRPFGNTRRKSREMFAFLEGLRDGASVGYDRGAQSARQADRYNGWVNYETWCIDLWLDNSDWTERANATLEAADIGKADSIEPHIIGDFAREIESWLEEFNPLAGQSSLFSDMLTHAIGRADFYELADEFLKNAQENMDVDAD